MAALQSAYLGLSTMTITPRCALIFLLLGSLLCFSVPCYGGGQSVGREVLKDVGTGWSLSPSFKFDALCFLNIMSADPFYLAHYRDEYARFEPRLTPAVRTALANITRRIKGENGGIVSAFLCLYFSATEDETLDDMLQTPENSESMLRNLKRTPYFNRNGWLLYLSVREDLTTALSFLKAIRFDEYWQQSILPRVRQNVAETEKFLPQYDVIAAIKNLTGIALPSNRITIYMLYYSHPHGIRVTGERFLANIRWPHRVVLQNAVHELLHPPYDLARDRELRATLKLLRRDEFLMSKVENHNQSFGYNSFESFIEEDCVRALEQVIQEKLGIAREPRQRWLEEDEGMHVFAVALYSHMKQENFNARRESFRDFLVRAIRSGKLAAGSIKPAYEAFYGDVKRLD